MLYTSIFRYTDQYLLFKSIPNASSIAERVWVEMDIVIVRIGGKAILTFDFAFSNFMFGRLLENKTALEVSQKIRELKIWVCG